MPVKYRPEIDGLRALAVASVVAYHAFPQLLPGGFVGVDVFFVISGYLISSILFRECEQGTFSLYNFYCRRIKRLIPALLVLLFLCFSYGSVVLLVDEFVNLAKSSLSSSLFVQNIVLYNEDSYFAPETRAKPLMHIWSLSVEEQFYIFVPVILSSAFVACVFNRRGKRYALVSLLAILFIVSLIANIVVSLQSGTAAFFLPQYRVWEFLAGTALAYRHYTQPENTQSHAASVLRVFFALALILVSCLLFKSSHPYPGWRALLPVVASVLLINSVQYTFLFNMLALPAVRYIGLISYPLYLFHWPALSFVHIVMGHGATPRYIMGALGIAALLSVATFEMVEKPIRKLPPSRVVWPLLGVLLFFCALCLLVMVGVLPKDNQEGIERLTSALQDRDKFEGFKHISSTGGVDVYACGPETKTTVFVGDSNMQQYAPRLQKLIATRSTGNRGALFITKKGTIPIPRVENAEETGRKSELWRYLRERIATDQSIDRVVVCGLWKVYFRTTSKLTIDGHLLGTKKGREKAFDSLEDFLRGLVAEGKEVYVISTAPIGDELNPRNSIERSFVGVRLLERRPALSKEQFESRNPEVKQALSRAAWLAGAHFVDPTDSLVVNGVCLYENEDGPIRYDGNHLRASYVRNHATFIDKTMTP